MNKLIKNFNEAQELLYKHVGFEEDLEVYPIDDRTYFFWELDENMERVIFAETMEELNNDDYYEDEFYRQRYYKKNVFKGDYLTMVIVDGYFAFYDNEKEVTKSFIKK